MAVGQGRDLPDPVVVFVRQVFQLSGEYGRNAGYEII